MTDLRPPDRLAEITERHQEYDGAEDGPGCLHCGVAWPCDVAWLLGELVEARTLADGPSVVAVDFDTDADLIDRLRAELDVERARADQLQADLDASRAESEDIRRSMLDAHITLVLLEPTPAALLSAADVVAHALRDTDTTGSVG